MTKRMPAARSMTIDIQNIDQAEDGYSYVNYDQDNMEPLIRNGDCVLIKQADKIEESGLYMLEFDGKVMIYRCRIWRHEFVSLVSEAPDVLSTKTTLECFERGLLGKVCGFCPDN